MFAASCIGVILLVICLELLRRIGKEYDALLLRQFQRRVTNLKLRTANLSDGQAATATGGEAESCGPGGACAPPLPGQQFITFRATPVQQLIRAAIHAVTFGVGYIVMLLAMYFNGYIIICIIIGAFLGKLLCDWMVLKVPLVVDDGGDGGSRGVKEEAKGIEEPTVCCG